MENKYIKVYNELTRSSKTDLHKQPSKPKALTNLKQYTCERYRNVRGNSQEDSLRAAPY